MVHNQCQNQNGPAFTGPQPLWNVFRAQWAWWIPGSVFSFLMASVLMSGWPTGLIPDLAYPYTYQGDGLSHSWLMLRAIEGWIFDNPRCGYPFGSSFLDYPGSDSGNLLLLKVIGLLSGHYQIALNIYYLLSFPVIFIASFCVLRAIKLSSAFAFSAAVLFTFLPFHFQRLAHLFYTWYFVVPFFFYVTFLICYRPDDVFVKRRKLKKAGFLFFFIMLASFGVYYALFGIIVLSSAAIAGWFRGKNLRSVSYTIIAILSVVLGVLINVFPNLINNQVNGSNPEVAIRSPAEAEIYGLKLIQLVLPRDSHRVELLDRLKLQYNNNYPLVNENSTATLGIIGATGLILLGLSLLINLSGGKIDCRLSLLAMIVFVLFLFGTIGGIGSLFSAFVSSSFRGWNRISIFIAFGSLTAFFLVLQLLIKQFFSQSKSKIIVVVAAIVTLVIGIYDQTVPACEPCIEQTRVSYKLDREFVHKIERSMPIGSAIYQLPYMPFPEVPDLHRLGTYDLVAGFLHSKSLRWSYSGMKGREGDLFYRSLSQEPIEKQLGVIGRLGFTGIYIDRRGFPDNAQALIDKLTELVGLPMLARADNEVVFFRLKTIYEVDLSGMSNLQIMQKAGYIVDKLGSRYPVSLADGIDFTRRDWPDFIRKVSGLSGPECWGRWSDANLAPVVRFDFFSPLPQKFTLVLSIQPFGPNANHEFVLNVGAKEHRVNLQAGENEVRVPVELGGERVDSMVFKPPHPASPRQLGISSDSRKLGIGFSKLRFEE